MISLECKICGHICASVSGLGNHIHIAHIRKDEISSIQEYYDMYIKTASDGICKTCGNKTKFRTIKSGYDNHCNLKCANADPDVRARKYENTKKSLMLTYGVDNPSKISMHAVKVKATKQDKYNDPNYNNSCKNKETNLKNHGGVHSTATIEYKQKYKRTCRAKYNTDHHTQSDIVKQKSIDTCRAIYGVDHAQQSPEIKKKSIETNKKLYGGTLHGSETISCKIKNTMKDLYGVEYAQQNKIILEKTQQTNLLRYGTKYTCNNPDILYAIYGVNNSKLR